MSTLPGGPVFGPKATKRESVPTFNVTDTELVRGGIPACPRCKGLAFDGVECDDCGVVVHPSDVP